MNNAKYIALDPAAAHLLAAMEGQTVGSLLPSAHLAAIQGATDHAVPLVLDEDRNIQAVRKVSTMVRSFIELLDALQDLPSEWPTWIEYEAAVRFTQFALVDAFLDSIVEEARGSGQPPVLVSCRDAVIPEVMLLLRAELASRLHVEEHIVEARWATPVSGRWATFFRSIKTLGVKTWMFGASYRRYLKAESMARFGTSWQGRILAYGPYGKLHQLFKHRTDISIMHPVPSSRKDMGLSLPEQWIEEQVASTEGRSLLRQAVLELHASLEVAAGQYAAVQSRLVASVPEAFITVKCMDARDRAIISAMKDAGVRVIWTNEGLGQLTSPVMEAYDNAWWWHHIPERWLLSEHTFGVYAGRESEGVRHKLTGYLGYLSPTPRRSRAARDEPPRRVLYALSSISDTHMASRPLVEESGVEVVEGLRSFLEATKHMQGLEVVVKAHGHQHDGLWKVLLDHYDHARISNRPIPALLKQVDAVVIYHSSVGFEAAMEGVPVVVYNHTGRPGYLKSLIEERGLAELATIVGSPRDLVETLSRPLPRPKVDFKVLANASPGYDAKAILDTLLDGTGT